MLLILIMKKRLLPMSKRKMRRLWASLNKEATHADSVAVKILIAAEEVLLSVVLAT
jgi:hypothetical protein